MRTLAPAVSSVTAAACGAMLIALSACGDRRVSPASPTLVAPALDHSHHAAAPAAGGRFTTLDHLPGHAGMLVVPNYGSALGGDLVTITGTGLAAGATVMFGLAP